MRFIRLLLTAGMLAHAETSRHQRAPNDHARTTGVARLPRQWPALYSNPARGTRPRPPANPRSDPWGMRSGLSEHE